MIGSIIEWSIKAGTEFITAMDRDGLTEGVLVVECHVFERRWSASKLMVCCILMIVCFK